MGVGGLAVPAGSRCGGGGELGAGVGGGGGVPVSFSRSYQPVSELLQ